MTIMTQVDPLHLRPFFGTPSERGAMTRHRHEHRKAPGESLLDVLHLGAILIATAWTAKLIAAERFGSIGGAAMQLTQIVQMPHHRHGSVTIILNEGARTAAR
jgi:hypothetical protein